MLFIPFEGYSKNKWVKWVSLLVVPLFIWILLPNSIFPPALAVSDTAIMLNCEYIKDTEAFGGETRKVEGATITGYYDLISMGLAWNENIREDARFLALCNQIENEFFK